MLPVRFSANSLVKHWTSGLLLTSRMFSQGSALAGSLHSALSKGQHIFAFFSPEAEQRSNYSHFPVYLVAP